MKIKLKKGFEPGKMKVGDHPLICKRCQCYLSPHERDQEKLCYDCRLELSGRETKDRFARSDKYPGLTVLWETVLDWIVDFITQTGLSPTLSEISAGNGMPDYLAAAICKEIVAAKWLFVSLGRLYIHDPGLFDLPAIRNTLDGRVSLAGVPASMSAHAAEGIARRIWKTAQLARLHQDRKHPKEMTGNQSGDYFTVCI